MLKNLYISQINYKPTKLNIYIYIYINRSERWSNNIYKQSHSLNINVLT